MSVVAHVVGIALIAFGLECLDLNSNITIQ